MGASLSLSWKVYRYPPHERRPRRSISATRSVPRSAATAARWRRVRTDDLAAIPIARSAGAQPGVDWQRLDDVIYGCANQAGEDNRNVARMALLLAGLPEGVPGVDRQPAVRLEHGCGRHGRPRDRRRRDGSRGRRRRREHVARAVRDEQGRRAVRARASRSRTPRSAGGSSTRGWSRRTAPTRWPRPPRTSPPSGRSRARIRTRSRCAASSAPAPRSRPAGWPRKSCRSPCRSAKDRSPCRADEHPRPDTTLEALAELKPIVRPDGTVTAGNASGINDGACAVLLASEEAVQGARPDAARPLSWRRRWPASRRG